MSSESKKHSKLCKKMALIYNAEIVSIGGNQHTRKGKYFPDVRNNDVDIELEIMPKNLTIKNKISKWDKGRKKVLVIGLWDYIFDNFNEIWIENEKGEVQKVYSK